VSVLAGTFLTALRDVFPAALVLFLFQYRVLLRPFARPRQVAAGFGLMVVGLALVLFGLEYALFPVGDTMIHQLLGSAPSFAVSDYGWAVAFAAAITFAGVFAEPVLTVLAHRAEQISGGTIAALGVRLVVALGAAFGAGVSVLRIVHGIPMYAVVIPVVLLIVVQARVTPRVIRPLAYDAGVAGISTIMVPLLVAIGGGVAAAIPGRSVLADGFGLVALAAVVPVVTMMGYAQAAAWLARRRESASE
jgi:hypothetical protein